MIKHLFLYNIKYISNSYPKKKKNTYQFQRDNEYFISIYYYSFFFIKLRVIMDNKTNSLLLKDI